MKKLILPAALMFLGAATAFAGKTTMVTLRLEGGRIDVNQTVTINPDGSRTLSADCDGNPGACAIYTYSYETASAHFDPVVGAPASITFLKGGSDYSVVAVYSGDYVSHSEIPTEHGTTITMTLAEPLAD
jgi:hypothetical protein